MFVRIVKMHFQADKVDAFLLHFENHKVQIRNFDGCRFLELCRGKDDPCIFFTYSYWETEEHLETYRNSTLFKEVWAATKTYFDARPEAWSVDKVVSLL